MRRGDRAGAQDKGTVSNDKSGAPGADDKSQTLGGSGQTGPNDSGGPQLTTIDPNGIYVLNPKRPDIKLTGEQVLAVANRGVLLDQTQSKLQKTEDLLQQSVTRVAELEKEGVQSKSRIDDIDLQERILGHLKTIGFEPGKKADGGDDDLYGTGGGDGSALPAGVTAEQLFQTIKTMTQEAVQQSVAKAEEAAEKKTASVIDEKTIQQERQRQLDESVGRQFRTDVSKLRNVMPDIPESSLTDLAKLNTTASALELEARDLYDAGKIEDGDGLWAKAQENREDAFRKRKELSDQQAEVAAERDRAQAIEMINSGGPPGKELKYKEGPTRNKKVARERAEERLEEAKRREAELQKYTSP